MVEVDVREFDVDGVIDEARSVRYIGRAMRLPTGQWVCLANVAGTLCRVEIEVKALSCVPPASAGSQPK
jgi:hypothetical protein